MTPRDKNNGAARTLYKGATQSGLNSGKVCDLTTVLDGDKWYENKYGASFTPHQCQSSIRKLETQHTWKTQHLEPQELQNQRIDMNYRQERDPNSYNMKRNRKHASKAMDNRECKNVIMKILGGIR